jgi:hypothetical protein
MSGRIVVLSLREYIWREWERGPARVRGREHGNHGVACMRTAAAATAAAVAAAAPLTSAAGCSSGGRSANRRGGCSSSGGGGVGGRGSHGWSSTQCCPAVTGIPGQNGGVSGSGPCGVVVVYNIVRGRGVCPRRWSGGECGVTSSVWA